MIKNEQKIANLGRLNKEQKQAVTHQDGPLLIVAGAGTGKTTVITERIAWLIEEELAKPEEILALTFTDKAAGEMEERVDKALPYGYTDLWVMTFHAFSERILHTHALDIGVPNDFRLLTQTEQWLLVRANLEKFNLDYYRPLGNPTKFIHALVKHFSRCKDEEIWPEDYLKYTENLRVNLDGMEASGGKAKGKRQKAKDAKEGTEKDNGQKEERKDESEIKRLEEVANAYHIYQQLLLDNNTLDFGDLINYTLKLFRTRLKILKKYQEQFKYILVDEFQDTNFSQYELVKLLAGEKVPVYGDGLNVRDWIHVLDHGKALDLLLHKGNPGEVYNIGSDNERNNMELTQMILKVLGKDEEMIEYVTDRPGHDRKYAIDATKIKESFKNKSLSRPPDNGHEHDHHNRDQEFRQNDL